MGDSTQAQAILDRSGGRLFSTDLHGPYGQGTDVMLVDQQLTRSVIGAFYEVYDTLGYGLLENPYVGAFLLELTARGHRVEREVPVAVQYKGHIVGTYRTDLLVDARLIVEVKADAQLTGIHERQLRNYLRCSTYELGLLFGFGVKPEFRRFIHTNNQKRGFLQASL